ncbi:3D-(3,5/4)-trihydroxycyclohexane-1,2-dione acylhydrolase (decyclizing) [Vibrio coralliilyticus]|uniref:3D-(3,5/4)-trihydroxycyclohexane-1,2-dione acylhydrolase (decyclizing) n=1 Tax=Vibrio coralliilyticus TaxID=190893 RepID=UPI00148D81B0|nr:3D-(3,5/4)-trihydroxycyclohexane-1,2-dione acylhydrolase (decyclizing) [Vibrio coralliilyticus]NOI31285.1 3D-(3,5/4)-trihydroxycyclohexane-1,2-dione acylhydrolase (decyclizing) [Vibrio coralliilyticus]NOI50497.1 3D-(3,5/4)-trihydroxycyclohexane-1,2-dione acylhydrolase (decyclizing) [Vibrio coralliilyticus]NRF26239.1 3D-(3,5/4)-trihydroxycyclohexane-1,2-dione acylhydrolase (decyclizing) [Vibrio coralliilyticus]NRF80278.1 3D-(3,5/4)-trihydroxycyclohexane-1,2-dione acylhydrolase (decyclizing) [
MANTIRLTMAQALVKFMQAQKVEVDGQLQPIFEGVFAIFGHGNVAGLGEALFHVNDELPTYRAHNEQAMAHSAIAFAKANNRRRMMAATTSVGPGALNMVTAAALAHVNRLPVLLLPGDTFATREPDPVLQQVEDWSDATITPNDCFKPVSRFFDRITRPEQLLNSLPQAMRVLTDPVECGPVTLSLPQDVQTMAFDYPEHFFAEKVHRIRRPGADEHELQLAIETIAQAKQPLVIAGGGIHYAEATQEFSDFVEAFGLPVGETQAGKGALAWDHPSNLGSIGVTGSEAVNTLASEADVVIAVGTRLQDFTSSSRALFRSDAKIVSLNVNGFDATKHYSTPLVADAKSTLPQLSSGLIGWNICPDWKSKAESLRLKWNETVEIAMTDRQSELPTDAEVIGAVNRAAQEKDIVVCAAGGLPGELHKLWRTRYDKGYHLEYGFSCMGYEIAGGLGVKMAKPDSEVFVMVGDGSYLMLNSEIATSVMLGQKLVVVVLDNRGYGCINRLQQACGGAGFNNLLQDCNTVEAGAPKTDFAGHARSLGASAEKVGNIAELEQALIRAKAAESTYVITLDTDPLSTTESGGSWWEVAVPEVSFREPVREARKRYEAAKKDQVI